MPDYDFTGLVDDEDISAPLQSTMGEAMKVEPDTHAKNLDISKMSGVPVDLVNKDPKGIQEATRKQQFDFTGLMERSPNTGNFLTNYDQAAVAHDDTENLEGIEKLLNLTLYGPIKMAQGAVGEDALDNLGSTTARRFKEIGLGLQLEGVESFDAAKEVDAVLNPEERGSGFQTNPILAARQQAVERATPAQINSLAGAQEHSIAQSNDLLERIHQNKEEIDNLTPKDQTILGEGLRAGLESTALLAPALLTAALTKTGTPVVLTLMGLQTNAAAYSEARSEGLEPEVARSYATIKAAIEVGTEALPVGSLVNMMKTGFKSAGGRQIVQFMIKEVGTEQLATLLETFADYKFGLDDEMIAAVEAGDTSAMLDIQTKRQAVTFVAALVGGGSQIGIASTVNKAGEIMQSDDEKLQTKHQTEQVSLDQLVELAEESKVKERSPEKFKQFIEGVVGKDLNVHLDAVQASLYLQEVGQEVIDGDTFLTGLQQKLQGEAELTGDISLPVAEFMTDIAGSDHFEALRSATTLSSETLAMVGENKVEAEQNIESQIHMRSIVEAEAKKIENLEQIKAVMATAREQLVATGRVDENAASALAEMVAGYVAQTGATSNNINETLQQVYTRMGLDIQGVVKDEVTETEIVLPPSSFAKEQNFGELTTEEQAVDEFGDSVTITQNMQTEWDRLAKRRNVTQTLVDCLNNG